MYRSVTGTLVAIIPIHNRTYLVDKGPNVYAYGLSPAVVEHQTPVLRGGKDAASERVVEIPAKHKNRIARFLEVYDNHLFYNHHNIFMNHSGCRLATAALETPPLLTIGSTLASPGYRPFHRRADTAPENEIEWKAVGKFVHCQAASSPQRSGRMRMPEVLEPFLLVLPCTL
jgi:hypothetical protein